MTDIQVTTGLIRPARLDDLPQIMKIEALCFDEGVRESAETYRRRIEVFSDGFLVLEASDGLSGFATSEIWPGGQSLAPDAFALGHPIEDRFDPDGAVLYVSSLAVDPARRGEGYGPALFDALLESIPAKYPRVDRVLLLVAEDWFAARAIYERRGFSVIRRFEAFFGGGAAPAQAGIVMGKDLR